MARPKFLYVIDDGFHVHGNDTKSLILQQGDVLGREGEPDKHIFIDRKDATKLRDVLDQWLNEPEDS